MIPVHELLSRIHWDRSWKDSAFSIVYEDRMIGMLTIPVVKIIQTDSFSFGIYNEDGIAVTIPMHRIRKILRDGVCIWCRDGMNILSYTHKQNCKKALR